MLVGDISLETVTLSSNSLICPARTKSAEGTADVLLDGAVLDGGIALGGGDGRVAEDALDDWERDSTGKEQGSAGMSCAVHGDVLSDAGTCKGMREQPVGLGVGEEVKWW